MKFLTLKVKLEKLSSLQEVLNVATVAQQANLRRPLA
jgi:hypothetical protein